MKTRNYTVTVRVGLFGNGRKNKFDTFAADLSGQNIDLIDSTSKVGERVRNYTFDCTQAGVAILLDRWTERLGRGMANTSVSVIPA
jgi:hypothetical protein